MFRRGDIFDNPVTGERATILLGTRETSGLLNPATWLRLLPGRRTDS
jgi:hypothetical protein